MKKMFSFVLIMLASLLFVPLVSAQYYFRDFGSGQFIDSMVNTFEPILRFLLGGQDWTGYLLFEKLLLFILVSVISYLVLNRVSVFQDNKSISKIVAIIVGLIGIRNLNYLWINTVLSQYQVLFIAVAGILPFIIYWFFLESFQSSGLRKVGWIFFAVIYFGLWITSDTEAYVEVYLWTAVFALAYAFILDTWVHQWLNQQAMKKQFSRSTWNNIADINDQINKITKQVREGSRPAVRAQDEIRELMKLRKSLAGNKNLI